MNKHCLTCDLPALNEDSNYCTKCGKELTDLDIPKICELEQCQRRIDKFEFQDHHIYCDFCGNILPNNND